MPVLFIDCRLVLLEQNLPTIISTAFRDAKLFGASVYLDNFSFSDEKNIRSFLRILSDQISKFSGPVFIASENRYLPVMFDSIFPIVVQFPSLPVSDQKSIWEYYLDSFNCDSNFHEKISELFQFTPQQIQNTVLSAKNIVKKSDTAEDIELKITQSAQIQSETKLITLAKKINPVYSWNDIILSPDKKNQLQEIFHHVKNRNRVFDDWGFENKFSLGKGINILFSGESGTGKTMAAEILAKELSRPLYKIDLSMIMSKYIGETEKNLNQIFEQVANSRAILFFDEADALFGKRTEIKDSHDRYANIEVNFLLQKLEEHHEIVILASNLPRNVDDAFTRRMNFWIEFPFPDEKNRMHIWSSVFPSQTPLSDDIDFSFLAKNFKIAGGHIKNIALRSAFMAAQNSDSVKMSYIILSIKREFEKLGKPVTKSDFGKYFELF